MLEKVGEFVVEERPAEGKQSWASEVRFENETVLMLALKNRTLPISLPPIIGG